MYLFDTIDPLEYPRLLPDLCNFLEVRIRRKEQDHTAWNVLNHTQCRYSEIRDLIVRLEDMNG